MGEDSKIEWTDSTGGPWLGCTEVSPGCAHCYARELMERRLFPIIRKAYKVAGFTDWETRPVWGGKAPRVVTKGFWDSALALNRKSARDGVRRKMFPSMIDWLDECPAGMITQDGEWVEPIRILADLLKLIHDTPNLDWLLLSKRPENWGQRMMQVETARAKGAFTYVGAKTADPFQIWLDGWLLREKAPDNVWIGSTVEDQKRADECIPELLKIPAKVRFLSVEPMLEAINLDIGGDCGQDAHWSDGIHWVICGGESGPKKRPFNCDWARSIKGQCEDAGVPYFFKQVDKVRPIPPDLMIREFPL